MKHDRIVTVTRHALARYLLRFMEIDTQKIKRQLQESPGKYRDNEIVVFARDELKIDIESIERQIVDICRPACELQLDTWPHGPIQFKLDGFLVVTCERNKKHYRPATKHHRHALKEETVDEGEF